MTRRSIIVVYLLCATLGSQPASAESQEHSVSFTWSASVASRYLFQGIDYSNGNPVIQPTLSVDYRGLSLTSWSNFDLDARHFNELDWLVGYTMELGSLSLTPGYTYLQYPNQEWDSSQEVYLDASLALPIAVSLSSHYDFDEGDGSYFTLSVSRTVEMLAGSVEFGSSLFYQREYYAMSGIPALEFTVAYSTVVRGLMITPAVSYFATWDNADFRDDAAVPDRWLVSLTVSPSE